MLLIGYVGIDVFVYLGGNFSPLESTEWEIYFRFTTCTFSSSKYRIQLVNREVLGAAVPVWRGTRGETTGLWRNVLRMRCAVRCARAEHS